MHKYPEKDAAVQQVVDEANRYSHTLERMESNDRKHSGLGILLLPTFAVLAILIFMFIRHWIP